MPINRTLWQSTLNSGWVPAWPCPRCGSAALEMEKDSLRTAADATSAQNRNERDYDDMQETGRFVCLLRCMRTYCKEVCAVSGNYQEAEGETDHGSVTYDACRPTSITPPPPMIQIPRACPPGVTAEATAAFSLFWSDYAACLNRIRNALELILDDLKVPRTVTDKVKKKKHRLSLHNRIEKLKKKRPKLTDICNRMMAVKHLGNAGSHPGVAVTDADVFDGFNILEWVLQDMYSEHSGELARAVKEINKREGPRKKKD